jgi:hypothetical protein
MTDAAPLNVLFVGNSYTFYNDVPSQVVRLAEEAGRVVVAQTVAEGGADVKLHFDDATGARTRIGAGGYDVLVLQDQSGGPLHDRARFEAFAPRLARLGLARGARLVWYQTWARAEGSEAYASAWSGGSPRAMTEHLRDAYRAMAKEVGGDVAPVGDAWAIALMRHRGLVLHDDDLHHAAPSGSHLAALVLAATIAGTDPATARYLPADVDASLGPILRSAAVEALRTRVPLTAS